MKNVVFSSMIFPDNSIPTCFTHKEVYENFEVIKNKYNQNIENLLKENFTFENGSIRCFNGRKNINFDVCKGTEPIEFVSSKNDGSARYFSIPNPLVQVPLNWYIQENKEIILNMQINEQENFISNSRYYEADGDIISLNPYDDDDVIYIDGDIIQNPYKDTIRKKHTISNGKYYQMVLDVSNCFNSIYTHILSWEISDINEKKIMNNLDVLIRNTNKGETRGIPIGPYTSGLIAEILLSKVDSQILKIIQEKKLDISYVRLVDDFYIYSDSKEELEETVKYIFEQALSSIKLELNSSKIKIEEFPFLELPSQNIQSIYFLEEKIKKLKQDKLEIDEDLDVIESIIFEINQSMKNSTSSCKYLLKVLNLKIKNNEIEKDFLNSESIEILIDYLINMMFKYNILSENLSNFIITILEYSNIDKLKIIKKWIKKCETRKSNIRESIYIWLGYIILKTKTVDSSITEYFCNTIIDSDLGFILCMEYLVSNNLLQEKKIEIKNKLQKIQDEIKAQYSAGSEYMVWYSKYWLFFYTNEIRWKVHSEKGFGDTILNRINLEKLETNTEQRSKLNLFYIFKELGINFFEV